jgi:hypothetical protein
MTMTDKYTHMDELAALGFLANALGGGGDRGQAFPRSDAEDMSRGLRFIPGEVTVARRQGQHVPFIQDCRKSCCWYWQFPDGSRTYYWDRWQYEEIARANGIELVPNEYGTLGGDAGPCPFCGNPHTSGGHIKREDLRC